VREKESKFKGKIILGTDNKFNISVNRTSFVCNGETFWEYDSRQKRVTIQKVTPGLSKSIPTELLKLLKTANFTENKKTNSVVWQDKETVKNGYEKVEVFFANSQISKIITLDTEKNVTTYNFEKTTFLKNVSDNIFNFVIPQGVQIYEN
jgi:outer membrane lipoprotein-sorting protein